MTSHRTSAADIAPYNATTSCVRSGRWLETPSGGEAAFGQPGLPAVHDNLRAENRSFYLSGRQEEEEEEEEEE